MDLLEAFAAVVIKRDQSVFNVDESPRGKYLCRGDFNKLTGHYIFEWNGQNEE